MRRLLPLGATVFAASCSVFLGETPGKGDPPSPDAAVSVDAALPACDSPESFDANLVDDTLLSNGGSSADFNFNDFGTMTITPEFPSVGLLRFDVNNLPENAEILSAALTLPHAFEADECGGDACDSCAGITRAGDVRVFLASDDWIADEVTWNDRGATKPWTVPGAAGPDDRGRELGQAPYTADSLAVIELSFERGELTGERLSLLIEADGEVDSQSSTKLVVPTLDNSCVGNQAAPRSTLAIDYCPR